MTIILVRHGAYNGAHIDPEEGLSELGSFEVKTLLKKLQEKNIHFDHVYCSPKTRAKQTASLLAGNLPIEEIEILKPSSDPKILYDFIQTLSGDNLLVGHNPLLSYLSSYFNHPVEFKTAGCLVIKDEIITYI